jgi:hypothetical protein
MNPNQSGNDKRMTSVIQDATTQEPNSSNKEFPYPDNITPEELGIDLTQGPDFESLHDPNAPSSGNLLELPESIKQELERYLNERIITPEIEDEYGLSVFSKQLNRLYREAAKLYFTADYVVNYNSESAIRTNMKHVPPVGKKLIQDVSLLLLIFADPKFLSLLFVFFIL